MSKKAGYKNTWYKDWFGQDYLTIYKHRDTEDAVSLVKLISLHIKLKPGLLLLDVGCGNARHAFQLAKSGAQVIGVDLSRILLNEALNLRNESSNPGLIQGDMRYLPFKSEFDGVVNLFTSFGYFSTDDENNLAIQEMTRVLKPDGYFILDYLNADFVRKNLIPVSSKTHNGLQIKEKRRIENNRVIKEIQIKTNSGVNIYHESVRLFGLEDIQTMLLNAGIAIDKIFGGYHGEAFSKSGSRLIVIGHKK